jgi:acyl-coenzyme A thioesterase PaaI-like protein
MAQAPVAGSFIVYSHIGTWSTRLTDYTAEGMLRLRDDLRQPDGLLAAPLGVMILDCASSNTHPLALSAPTRVDVHLYDPAPDVDELRIRGRVLRHGRTQIFTDARIEDASDPTRAIAYGTVTMAVTGPAPSNPAPYGGERPDLQTSDSSPRPPLVEVFGGVPAEDGGYSIPALTPSIGHGRLHSGPMQTLGESAAMNAVRLGYGAKRMRTEHLGTSVVTSGRAGPFSIIPHVIAVNDSSAGCYVEVIDRGAENRLIATMSVRLRVLD